MATFTPRLNDNGILNNPKWYDENIFYQSGYGMPNCTCYAWGRFWEESNDDPNDMSNKPTTLPTGDGGQWWEQNLNSGAYPSGYLPNVGAVICFSDNNGGSGHVAIVEEIDNNGNLTCSNSAYGGTYFFLSTVNLLDGYNWSHYTFQGFIYNPAFPIPIPPTPESESKKSKFPWRIFTRPIRNRRLTK